MANEEEERKEDVSGESDEEESLRSKQKQELKELRGKIQALKRSVPKGDKKKKKEITTQIAQLELEIKQKHEVELDEFLKKRSNCNVDDEVLDNQTVLGKDEETLPIERNPSKAQRKKERRAKKQRDFEERIARGATSDEQSTASIEVDQLVKQLNIVGLQIKEINPDGHCMFAAISDQLLLRDGIKVEVEQLRHQCADYIEQHQKDLLPFLVDPETGETFNDEKLAKYLSDLKHTAMWGGQLELRALSHVYQLPINVHQANCTVLTIGDEYHESTPIDLIYHKHLYGLGEHYNSAVRTGT